MMKSRLLLFLLTTGCTYAQTPATTIRRDSVPSYRKAMPTVLPHNSFYRHPADPTNVVRATLDNMPVKIPDSSTHYTMQPYRPSYPQREPSPTPFPEPKSGPKKP